MARETANLGAFTLLKSSVHRGTAGGATTSLDENSFRGMASVFGNLIDAFVPTRIQPGSFTKTLRENRKRIKVLWSHNADWPIGLPTKMEETSVGLYVEAKISPTALGKDVLQLMRDGVISEMSIGFEALKYQMVNEGSLGQVRHITELRLWEFSPVSFAANSLATIDDVNGRDITQSLAELDRLAAEVGLTQVHDLDASMRDLAIMEAELGLGGRR